MHPRLMPKLEAVNLVHEELNLWIPKLQQRFAPYVGKSILRKDDTLKQPFNQWLPVLSNSALLMYRISSKYSLGFAIKACISTEDACVYYEQAGYIGDIDNSILKSVRPFTLLRCDYTAEEILRLHQELKVAKAQVDAITSKLHPFLTFN